LIRETSIRTSPRTAFRKKLTNYKRGSTKVRRILI
jgi:hypothetical protein